MPELAGATAERLNLPEHEITRVGLAAQLHDIGKTAIPQSILAKPSPLDDEESAFMHRQTVIGERIVAAAPSLAHTANLVRSSHERFDGAGYPDGLAGTDIPLGSRIITVCDAYDAMIAPRPNRRPMSTPDALRELRLCAGERGASDARRREGASLAPAARPWRLFRPPRVDHRTGDDRRRRTP